jgi:hypothetical protein
MWCRDDASAGGEAESDQRSPRLVSSSPQPRGFAIAAADPPAGVLAATSDGGATWHTLTTPPDVQSICFVNPTAAVFIDTRRPRGPNGYGAAPSARLDRNSEASAPPASASCTPPTPDAPGPSGTRFHVNAVHLGPHGTVLIDARDTWTAYDVSLRTGQIQWQLGSKDSSFTPNAAPGQSLDEAGEVFA